MRGVEWLFLVWVSLVAACARRQQLDSSTCQVDMTLQRWEPVLKPFLGSSISCLKLPDLPDHCLPIHLPGHACLSCINTLCQVCVNLGVVDLIDMTLAWQCETKNIQIFHAIAKLCQGLQRPIFRGVAFFFGFCTWCASASACIHTAMTRGNSSSCSCWTCCGMFRKKYSS